MVDGFRAYWLLSFFLLQEWDWMLMMRKNPGSRVSTSPGQRWCILEEYPLASNSISQMALTSTSWVRWKVDRSSTWHPRGSTYLTVLLIFASCEPATTSPVVNYKTDTFGTEVSMLDQWRKNNKALGKEGGNGWKNPKRRKNWMRQWITWLM